MRRLQILGRSNAVVTTTAPINQHVIFASIVQVPALTTVIVQDRKLACLPRGAAQFTAHYSVA